MRILSTILFSLLCNLIISQQNKEEFTFAFDIKNPSIVLQFLFNGKYSNEKEEISWKPNSKELISINSLGFVTKVDTIMKYNLGGVNYSLFVLKSIVIDEEGNEQSSNADVPTMGLALFSLKEDSLVLISFNKIVCQAGRMATLPKINLVQLGTNFMTISVEEEDYKETDLFMTFYSLQEWELGKEVFSIPIWKIINYSETPIIQTSKIKIQTPKNSSAEYFELLVSNNLIKQTYPKETQIKKWDSFYFYNGRRWDKK